MYLNGTYYQVGGAGVPTSGSSKTGALIPATCVDCMFFAASYTSDAVITANFGNGYFGTTAITSAGSNGNEVYLNMMYHLILRIKYKNINTYGYK